MIIPVVAGFVRGGSTHPLWPDEVAFLDSQLTIYGHPGRRYQQPLGPSMWAVTYRFQSLRLAWWGSP